LRVAGGLVCIGAAVVLVAAAWSDVAWWRWLAAGVLTAGGAFQIIEGAVGWCALRATGWKTPL
jgi:hypothetical protein